jgi:peptidyl-prolyl cis-trans isomerase C
MIHIKERIFNMYLNVVLSKSSRLAATALLGAGLVLGTSAFAQAPSSTGEYVFDSQKPSANLNQPVAVVNGYTINQAELNALVGMLNERVQARMKTEAGRQEIVNHMVDEYLLEEAALQQGLDKDVDVAGALAAARRQVLVDALANKVIDKVNVTDEQIKQWYSLHLSDLMQPEAVQVKHILVKDKKDAEKLLAKLKKDKTQFSKLAMDNSLDPGTKAQGGELGFITRGQTVPEFEKAAFNTPVGELSSIVETQFGFHILLIEDKRANAPIPLENIKEQIVQKLKFENYLKPLKDKASIKLFNAEGKPAETAKESNVTAEAVPSPAPAAPAPAVEPAKPETPAVSTDTAAPAANK